MSDAQRGNADDVDHVVHFARGQEPPAAAFWSLTLYADQGCLAPNPAHRYALRNRDPFVRNHDGSLDLYAQMTPPIARQNEHRSAVRSLYCARWPRRACSRPRPAASKGARAN